MARTRRRAPATPSTAHNLFAARDSTRIGAHAGAHGARWARLWTMLAPRLAVDLTVATLGDACALYPAGHCSELVRISTVRSLWAGGGCNVPAAVRRDPSLECY